MEAALFAPGLGYYAAGATKLGPGGDFITAPERSPLFSKAVAHACQGIIEQTPSANILELGPGRGTMARDLMQALDPKPPQYYCLERSADLRERQQETIKKALPNDQDRFIWLDQLPTHFEGIILANEVADCLPAARFRMADGDVLESVVHLENDRFIETWINPITPNFKEQVTMCPGFPWHDGYTSEFMPSLPAWIKSLADALHQGVIILIDYGFPAREYYHLQRSMGTLMCHFQHHAHSDPFIHVGCQDITTHVNFSALAKAGVDAGLTLMGYGNQASFLLNHGLLDYNPSADDPVKAYQQRQAVMALTSPNEMGEMFKVMVFSKAWDTPVGAFTHFDQSERL